MSTEEQFKIATIVLGSVAGVLLLLLFITCCCCCRMQKGGGCDGCSKKKGKSKSKNIYASEPGFGYQGCPSCAANAYSGGSGCQQCSGGGGCRQGGSSMLSALDLMTGPRPGHSNPYAMNTAAPVAPVYEKTGPEYGRVLLNPPSSTCIKPSLQMSSGNCNTGGGCAYNMIQSPIQMTNNQSSAGHQFVLETSGKSY